MALRFRSALAARQVAKRCIWVKQQSVSPERIAQLEAIIIGASACLAAFLKPAPLGDGDFSFTLRELVLVA